MESIAVYLTHTPITPNKISNLPHRHNLNILLRNISGAKSNIGRSRYSGLPVKNTRLGRMVSPPPTKPVI